MRGLPRWLSLIGSIFLSNRMPLLALVVVGIILFGALGFLLTEGWQLEGSLWSKAVDSAWWSFVTMTTIGYGDIVPKTAAGRLVGSAVGFSGVVVLSVVTAQIASILVEQRLLEEQGLQKITHSGHTVVCGWNSHSENLLLGMARLRPAKPVVLVNNMPQELFADLRYRFRGHLELLFVRGDYTSESLLELANAHLADSCILLVDTSGENEILRSDERAIKGTLILRNLNPKMRICVELLDRHSEPHLVRARADEIIVRGEYTGLFLSGAALAPNISKVVEELVGPHASLAIESLPIPEAFAHKTYAELCQHLRKSLHCTVLGLQETVKDLRVEDILSDDLSMVDQFILAKFHQSGTELQERLVSERPLLNPPDDHPLDGHDVVIVLRNVQP